MTVGRGGASLVNLLMTVGRGGSVGRLCMVETDGLLMAHLCPVGLEQLRLGGDGVEGVGVGAHLVVDHVVPLNAHRPHHVLALLLRPQLEGVPPVLLVALGLEGGHTDLSRLFDVVHGTLLPIGRSSCMSNWGVVGNWPGWSVVGSLLVVDKGRLSVGNMLVVVDCSHRSRMVDLVGLVGGDGGSYDGRLVASVTMADAGERASNSVGGVEVALGAGQGSQAGADKQDRLMTEHGCPSSNLNRLSNHVPSSVWCRQ